METAPALVERIGKESGDALCLRIDDIGASSKHHEVYSERWRPFGNFLWIKYLPRFRAWGKYREMVREEWDAVFDLLSRYGAKLTVAVTATWVEYDGTLVPFPEKFPEEAAKLREGEQSGLVEIANHGLTHCVVEGFKFRPRLFSSNRKFHREFWDWIPADAHFKSLERAQGILKTCFRDPVTTLVPPGNVFSAATVDACSRLGIRRINCNARPGESRGVRILGNDGIVAFHDRELVLEGVAWLERILSAHGMGRKYKFVREL